MELLSFLAVFAVVLFVLLLLPLVSGVGSYKYQKVNKSSRSSPNDKEHAESGGYLSPEERKQLEEEEHKKKSKLAKLKNIKLSKDDIPFKFKANLTDDNNTIRNRKTKKTIDTNPSNFDFDLDELIQEEQDADLREEQKDFENRKARNKEELEELV